MKIHRAKESGFCFGVRRAIKIALQTAVHKNVYIKGDLVHNEEVCERIEKSGIKKIQCLKEVPYRAILIIKAHGEPIKTYNLAQMKNIKIVDATCPMVKDIHKKAQELEKKGCQVIVIGDKNHEETIGIAGNIKDGLILEKFDDIDSQISKIKSKIGVVCQSTQNIENVAQIICRLAERVEELLFINTICEPTKRRQQEIEALACQCDAVLIVGSKKSANTHRLYSLAKGINKNSFWLDNPQDLKVNRFRKFKSLAIMGGASTPQEILDDIYKKLKSPFMPIARHEMPKPACACSHADRQSFNFQCF